MRRGFTLVELMIVIIILSLSVEYVFSYLRVTITEIKYIKDISTLSFQSFRAMEIATKGVDRGSSHLKGLVTAKGTIDNPTDKIEFKDIDNIDNIDNKIELIDKALVINDRYEFNTIEFENLKSENIVSHLYEISFDSTLRDTKYTKFSRIIYVQ